VAKRKPAETEREWWQMLKSKDRSVIRSKKDWLAAVRDPKRNPLKGCSPKAIAAFTKSLKFVNGGLGHAEYGEVAKELSYFRFTALWAVFGLGMGLFRDYDNKHCKSRGTCATEFASVCTSNC
jgi:hypothetical protein